jgi:hypothetical protein
MKTPPWPPPEFVGQRGCRSHAVIRVVSARQEENGFDGALVHFTRTTHDWSLYKTLILGKSIDLSLLLCVWMAALARGSRRRTAYAWWLGCSGGATSLGRSLMQAQL